LDNQVVVASLKSWDGTRILGVFNTENAAVAACELARIDTETEDFHLDFVEINKVSMCQTILVDDKSYGRSFRRMHVYDNDDEQSKIITEK
jgi:hypothetical protein